MPGFYPLTFTPIYKHKLWGGRRFATLFGRDLPSGGNIGEAWEICDRGEDVSVVAAGELAGLTLRQLREQYPEELLGEQAAEHRERFPLLLKFIDAEQKLSMQVHPDDRYALRHEQDQGKCEAWYVVDAMPDAVITRDFRAGMTKEKVIKATQSGRFESIVNTFPVQKGDAIFVPPGTVHGIGGGTVIAEIQQNSDITYRVYDYNRTDQHGKKRELHVSKALEIISFRDIGPSKVKPVRINALHHRLVMCDYFTMHVYDFREPIHEFSVRRFRILCNVEGHGTIISPEGLYEDVDFHPGTVVLIPAAVKDFSLVPATRCRMLDIIPGKIMLKRGRRNASSV